MKNKKIIIAIVAIILAIAIIVTTATIIIKNNKKYTITFDTQGGNTIESIKIKANETLVLPKNPEKEGHIFLYWIDEENKAVSSNFKVTRDRKLTAKWAEATQEIVTVSFDTDGGNAISSMNVIKGEKITLPENPIKEGYNFKMWVYENGEQFNNEVIIEENIILKAIWEKIEEDTKTTTTNKNDTTQKTSQENKNENIQPTSQQNPQQEVSPGTQNVEVTSVSLNKNSLELIIGNSDTLTANISPTNATNKNITWSSSNSNIISVDNSGKVTAKAIGSATITAKSANGKTASATVYSDVEKITISVSNKYISKYGTIKSSTITVKTTPAVNVDASMYKWYAPDASGQNAAASFSGGGTSATITARDAWGSSLHQIPVTVSIGRKTSNKIVVYVEPKLSLSSSTGSLTIPKNTNVTINSTVDGTSWTFNSTEYAENINKQSKSVSFKTKNGRPYPQGFQLEGKTNAGQTEKISITVTP